jgi:hypothetical protein
MTRPPHAASSGRAKWRPVAFDLALAGAGAALALGVLAQLGADAGPMRVLAVYTLYAVAATVVLAVARAVAPALPAPRRARLAGGDEWVLRAWAGDWWHAPALDAGLVVLAGWLAVLGVRAGGDWWLPSLLVAATGAWFLVRVLLGVTGRRGREALWLTDSEVVHDSPRGRARAPRSAVVAVTGAGSRVLILLDRPSELLGCPRLWRSGRHVPTETISFVCSDTGLRASEVVRWIRSELALPAEHISTTSPRGRSRRPRPAT